MFAKEKHSSLLDPFISYEKIEVLCIRPLVVKYFDIKIYN